MELYLWLKSSNLENEEKELTRNYVVNRDINGWSGFMKI